MKITEKSLKFFEKRIENEKLMNNIEDNLYIRLRYIIDIIPKISNPKKNDEENYTLKAIDIFSNHKLIDDIIQGYY